MQERGRTRVGVPRETRPGEARVALTPEVASQLSPAGFDVVVEAGAGTAAGFGDASYVEHGASIGSRDEVFDADIVVQVRSPSADPARGRDDLVRIKPGAILVGLAQPLDAPGVVREMAERGATVFALELLPRIARAQSMDVLSSQATIAGYRAALAGAYRLPKLFPMLTTAAGTVPAARVLVLGAGVAGLQAMATAHRLGALVEGYDVRPASRDDVESVGGRFVELPLAPGNAEDAGGYAKAVDGSFLLRQQTYLVDVVAGADVVICTALIPGRPAPTLLTAEAVAGMRPGSVVIDAAAERGGNCEVTRPDVEVVVGGVVVLGPTNLPASVPGEASSMYARNIASFLRLLAPDGVVAIDPASEILRETLVARDGSITNPRIAAALEVTPA